MKGWIAISLGDVTGIGPEVALKALVAEAASDHFRYLLIGDAASTLRLNHALGIKLPLEPFRGGGGADDSFCTIHLTNRSPPICLPVPPPPRTPPWLP